MGEIGFPHKEFLHELKWWEIKAIIRGYNRRQCGMWSANRWQTYNLMQAFCGGKALIEAGIHKPTDLIKFPWDTDQRSPLSDDDIADLQAEMAAMNAQNKESSMR